MRFHQSLLAVVTALTILVAGTSLIRTTQSFYQLDFPVTWVERGLRVEEVGPQSSANLAGLASGDVITELDQDDVGGYEKPVFALASGSEHRLTVLRPDGTTETLPYFPPPPQIEPVYLARSLVAAIGLLCAIIVAFRTTRIEGSTFLLLASAALLVAAIPHRTAATAVSLSVLHRSAGAAMPFLLVRFFATFPNRRLRMLPLTIAMIVVVTGAGLTPVIRDLQAWWPAMLSMLRALFTTSLLFGIVVQVRRWWAAQKHERDRRQIEWGGLGLFVGLTPLVTLVLIPQWLGVAFEPFGWLAVLPIAAIPMGFLAGLTEYRLWDLEPISRDVVSATLVVTFGGLVFSLTNHVLQTYAAGLGNIRNLLAFATGIALVLLLQPVRDRVEPFLDQWLHHGRPTPRGLLTHSTRDLATATDPRALLNTLREILVNGLDIEPVATYLRSPNGGFQRVYPDETDGHTPRRLPKEIDDADFPQPVEDPLAGQGMTQRIPLERGGTTHGLLYLGLRKGVAPLGTEAGGVVAAFAAQAALGLESARRLDDLRRQAEEYRILHANTQRIIESSAAGILVCDAGGRILSANSGAAKIFDQLARDMVGHPLEVFLELPETWKPQLPLHAVNAEAKTTTTPVTQLILAVSVLELDTGTFNGRVVVAQDVTELRKLQDQVREQERLAGLGRLTAGLAHEINTPLTGIASYAQLLGEQTPPDDPRSDLLQKLVNQSFRVSRIVANLRELFRGGGDESETMDLGEAVERAALEAVRSLEVEPMLALNIPPEPVMVWAAPGAIDLAVANLVRNAVEASPKDGTILVRLVEENGYASVTVDDEGPGVPDPIRDRVFQAFVTTKTDRGGTGLGLAITRDMISRLGGDVWLDDRPQGGTRATIRLETCKQQAPAS